MKKNIFIFILFLIGTLNLSAQIKSSVEYPDSVFNGKIDIVYVFEVNDDIDSIKSLFYDKDKLEVLANPCINTIKSYVTRNGKTTRSDTIKFTYSFKCFWKGINRVPVLTIVDSHGKELSSPSNLSFTVVKNSEIVGDFMEATISTDKKTILLGDSVKCQIRLYTNMDARQMKLQTENIDKAVLHESPKTSDIPSKIVCYKGDSVQMVLYPEFYIIPTQAGRFYLQDLNCIVEYNEIDKSVDSVEAFFNSGGFIRREKVVSVPPLYIEVKNK